MYQVSYNQRPKMVEPTRAIQRNVNVAKSLVLSVIRVIYTARFVRTSLEACQTFSISGLAKDQDVIRNSARRYR